MLVIKNTPVDQIFSMKEMIVAIEKALKELPWGVALTCRASAFTIPIESFRTAAGLDAWFMGAYLQTDFERRLQQ